MIHNVRIISLAMIKLPLTIKSSKLLNNQNSQFFARRISVSPFSIMTSIQGPRRNVQEGSGLLHHAGQGADDEGRGWFGEGRLHHLAARNARPRPVPHAGRQAEAAATDRRCFRSHECQRGLLLQLPGLLPPFLG